MTVSWVLLINLGNVNNDMNVLLSIRKKRQRSSGSGGERKSEGNSVDLFTKIDSEH